jgi:putative phage-type endonuclease
MTTTEPPYVQLLPAGYDRTEWLSARQQGIGASEIATILGLSPWDSPFSLYQRKTTGVGNGDNPEMRVGRLLEDAVAGEYATTHPDRDVQPAGLYASAQRPWQLASPDRLLDGDEGLECKTAGSYDGWGEAGTDEIPVYYRAQALHQADVMGWQRTHLYVLFLHTRQFRAYIIAYDPADVAVLREAGAQFARRIAEQDPPAVDWTPATTRALKRLHPNLVDADVAVPERLARAIEQTRAHHTRISRHLDLLNNQLLALIGDNRRAVSTGRVVATRSVYDQQRVDTTRLRAEHPDVWEQVKTTSTVAKLLAPRSSKPTGQTIRSAL